MKNILLSVFVLLSFTAGAQTTAKITLQGVHSVPLAETKDSASVYVLASAVVDTRSVQYISYRWYKLSGKKCRIETPRQLGTRVFGLTPGAYRFGFIITDTRHRLTDTAYTNVLVR